MIIKSYEIQRKKLILTNYNFFLLYGENIGLKKDICEFIKTTTNQNNEKIENLNLQEKDILEDREGFYNSIYSGSLFSKKKIIIISNSTDKIISQLEDIINKFPKNVFLIFLSDVLEKKSKLRNFFEKGENTLCIACYLDQIKDLQIIATNELKKNNINLSNESLNLLIEKSNNDRNNLRNEIEKIKSFSLNNKNIKFNDIKSIINFSGEYKSDILVNECLLGNISQYKKILSELYINTVNQILVLRILSSKVHRLLNIKEQKKDSNNLDILINNSKPLIFWKEKPLVKKQLSIWNLKDLRKIINDINDTELLCKKNPQISNSIFFSFLSEICKKANSFS